MTLAINVAPVAANHLNVKTSDINNGAVTTPKLRDDAVKTAKIDNGAVTRPKIRNGAVNTAKLQNGAVTLNKLSPGVRPITSDWISVSTVGQEDENFDGTNWKKTQVLQVPQITQNVIDNGMVLVYMRFGFGENQRSFLLPYTAHTSGKPSTIDFYVKPGELHITRFSHDNSASVGAGVEVRYVIIRNAKGIPAPFGGAEELPVSSGTSEE